MSSKYDDAFFERMRKQFKRAEEALQTVHSEALLDWQFRLGDQWDQKIKAVRTRDGRPTWTINRIPQFIRQVTGEQRKNRPGIEYSPVGDGADIETAKIYQGLERHIERMSNADESLDTSFDHMLTGGFGFFRLTTCYVDDSFDQEICFEREVNPFAHFPDPRCRKADYSDARYWFVNDWYSVDDYQEEFPASTLAGMQDFGGISDHAPDWIKQDGIRVAEYFWIEESKEEIKRGDKKRTKSKKTVHWVLTNGFEILDETTLPGEFIPILPVLGEEVTVEGQRHLIGLVRYMREPQAAYNLWQSAMAEAIALAPKAPWQATAKQIEGYEDLYEQANNANVPVLPYNADPQAPEMPRRNAVEPPIQALTVAIAHADNDLHATTGLYDASLGERGPEQSGKAILLRQKQGDASVFGFQDSLPRALKHAGRIIASWIPVIYDAARIVRIVNPDGTSKMIPINQRFQDDDGLHKIFDLTTGRYDIAISTGPSYDTMREEAAQSILQLVQAEPSLMGLIGDLLVKCFDWPMAQEISARLKKALPPTLQDDNQNAQIPPQVQAKMAQQQQMIQQMTEMLHKLSSQLETKQIDAASRERIALISARAGVIEALIRAQSDTAKTAFQAELDHIDLQLSLIPDPAAQQGTQQPGAAPQAAPQQPQSAPSPLAA